MLVEKAMLILTLKLWTWSTCSQRLWWAYGELDRTSQEEEEALLLLERLGSHELANWEDKCHTHTHTPPSEKQFKVTLTSCPNLGVTVQTEGRWMLLGQQRSYWKGGLEVTLGSWQDLGGIPMRMEWKFEEKRMNWCSEEYRIQYGLCYFLFLL